MCPAPPREDQLALFSAEALVKTSELEGLQFQVAMTRYVEMRQGKIMPHTYDDYKLYIKYLSETFRAICQEREQSWEHFLIDTVDGDWCRWYQVRRDVGPGEINKELGLVRMCRKQIAASGSKLKPIEDYQRLIVPKDWEGPGRRLTPEEEKKWIATCVEYADHPLLGVAACVSLIALECGVGPGELKSVKMKNVHPAKVMVGLDGRRTRNPWFFRIDRSGAKRIRRERNVTCEEGERAEWALEKLYERALSLGCNEGGHYLIPGMNRNHTFDPTRKPRTWWNAFHSLQELAGVKFRFYDHRHHAVSFGLEDKELSFQELELYFGHISADMRSRYYHGTQETLQKVAGYVARRRQSNELDLRKKSVKTAEPLTKKCSECWSDIPVQARRCRYCQAVVEKALGAAGD